MRFALRHWGRCTVRLSIASSCLFSVVWETFTGISSADEEDRNACVHGLPPTHIRRVVHIHRDNITFSFICIDIEKQSGNILDFKLSPCFICSAFSFGYLPGV